MILLFIPIGEGSGEGSGGVGKELFQRVFPEAAVISCGLVGLGPELVVLGETASMRISVPSGVIDGGSISRDYVGQARHSGLKEVLGGS